MSKNSFNQFLVPIFVTGATLLPANIAEAKINSPEILSSPNQTELSLTETTIVEDIKNAGRKTGRAIREGYRNLRNRLRVNSQQTPENLCKRQRASEVIIVDKKGNKLRVQCKTQ